LADIFERIDRPTCENCAARVFLECHVLQQRNRKSIQRQETATPAAA
ncbi:MAG: hypothetical protein HY941_04340, partial [Gammaproteobacteria bacterium]|nr:hypothetical protein [Gammaproteobacteria bacterium]